MTLPDVCGYKARVLATDPGELVRHLSSQVARRHSLVACAGIRRLGAQPLSSYRFQHILIQNRLYDDLDVAEHDYLHGAVGDALVALYGDYTDEVAVQFARHDEKAGATAKAIGYLRQAAERAPRLRADREAVGAPGGNITIQQMKGDLLLRQGMEHAAGAEECFRQAIAHSVRIEAKSWELRATTSLCRLWAAQGRRQEARERLAAIYGWFTEGFATPDLVDARALLEELARAA